MLSKSTWELGYYYAVAYVCINQKFEFKIIAFCGAGVNLYSHATKPNYRASVSQKEVDFDWHYETRKIHLVWGIIFFLGWGYTNIIGMLPHSIPWIWCYIMKFASISLAPSLYLYLSLFIFIFSPVFATTHSAKWFCFETVDGEHVVRLFVWVCVLRWLLWTWSIATAAT